MVELNFFRSVNNTIPWRCSKLSRCIIPSLGHIHSRLNFASEFHATISFLVC